MSNKIFFVTSPIPDKLKVLLNSNEPLPPVEDILPHILVRCGEPNWDWTIQTFLYMKQAGLEVALVEKPVEGAICVAHFDDTRRDRIWAPNSFVVGIRADRSPLRQCEIEVVQSLASLGQKNSFFIPFWPQSRVIPRSKDRGDRIERISYFGNEGGLSPEFYTTAFIDALKDRGVSLNISGDPAKWHDYRETDLVLAIRNHTHISLLKTKPASKLINAWQAECIALLGMEPAYRAIGCSSKNYFEVKSPQDVLDTVTYLQQNRSRYQEIIQLGAKKYLEHDFNAVQRRWVEFLTGTVAEEYTKWKQALNYSGSTYRARRYWQSTQQWIEHKSFWVPIRFQQQMNRLLNQNHI